MTETLHSPLHSKHEELGASFTMFGDWEMPLKYGNELTSTALFARRLDCLI